MAQPEQYDLFGQIALRNRFTTLAQLQEALEWQAEKDQYKAIGQILVEKGYITPGAIDAVLMVQRELREATPLESTDPLQEAQEYCKRILKRGYARKDQLLECLKVIQAALKAGKPAPDLGQLLVQKGHLTEAQLRLLEGNQGEGALPQIEGYKILDEIRSGGMGTVYKARQLSMHRVVAIKILDPSLSRTETHSKRFLLEARALARLHHENTVGAFDVGEQRGLYYFVMEFVNGESVMEMIKREGPIKTTRALEITYQVARALEHVHSHRIIHRDIKPSNILINHKGVAKLCDLGFAKIDGEDPMVSVAGTTLGTPYYMSPEQAKGAADIDERSDIYSLGASLFHMMTARVPFKGKSAAEIMKRHVTDPLVFTPKEQHLFGQEVIEVVEKMMAKPREARHQTAIELMAALAPFLSHQVIGVDLSRVKPDLAAGGGGSRVLIVYDLAEATAHLQHVVAAVEGAGGRPAVKKVDEVSGEDLEAAEALIVGAAPAGLSTGLRVMLEDSGRALAGKVGGVLLCGDPRAPGALELLDRVQGQLLQRGMVISGGLRHDLARLPAEETEAAYLQALAQMGQQIGRLSRA